jgi:protoporphyrinogen oxidase
MRDTREGVVVIGAGPAGIGAAIGLGDGALVLERNPDLGGLCRTLELEGAVFDLGGHSFHTPHAAVRELVHSSLAMEEQPRQAWCYFRGDLIPYPFQKHFGQLNDAAIVTECRAGLADADRGGGCCNFDEYIERQYGAGIARHFLRPYNEKLWGGDLTRIAVDWTEERMAAPKGASERSFRDGTRTPLNSNTRVSYPAHGGFGEIFRALARRIPRLRLGQEIVSIDPRARSLQMANGPAVGWRKIVSTVPLPKLLALLPEVPAEVRDAVGRLEVLPVHLVLIALESRLDTPMQRIYCCDSEITGHKFVLNHNSSTYLRRRPRHGIEVEVSGYGRSLETDEALTESVLRGLTTLGIIEGRGGVRATRVVRLPFGYPVPTHERAHSVEQIRGWLSGLGICTVGRFGEWAYINSDEALHRGLCVGADLARSG